MKLEIGKVKIEIPDEEIKKTGEKIAGYLQRKLGQKKAKELTKPNIPAKQQSIK